MDQASGIQADLLLVQRINKMWPKRATVCSMDKYQVEDTFDPALPDYPVVMVPFYDHPKFQAVDDELKSDVLTWGWIGYNQRTVAAENDVVNPALEVITNQYLTDDDWDLKEAMRQTLVDEHYHTLMHMKAVERTKAHRRLQRKLTLPRSVTYRRLQALTATLAESWQKHIASIAFAVVAEISVNAYLNTLAKDKTIQPQNRRVAEFHNLDEYAHSRVVPEIAKAMYVNMGERQRKFFVRILPEALQAFVAQDYSMWEAILTQIGVPDAEAIIADTRNASNGGGVIMRDYGGLHRFASEINILQEIDFDFTGTLNTEETTAA